MRILIKGAGDLATGIASRLYHSGHQIVMTEIAVPLTVRRMAALSRAVYEGTAVVEDMKGILVYSEKEAEQVLADGDIAVIVDANAKIAAGLQPDVIVDAILAKRNTGTKITDAPFVIGVGPGFTAGIDCNCVVETKRGHTLGNIFYSGSALPNTGIPGDVGGYTTERLIRAAADGEMQPLAAIGDIVEKGQAVAVTGGKEVYARMSGVIRGLLQPGVRVSKGLKIGDIDARCEKSHCFTISDKARAVGGGVLEAVTRHEHLRGKYALVVLAAGKSTRFGENKLLAQISGRQMFEYMLDKISAFGAFPTFIVTGYEEIEEKARRKGIRVVRNDEPELGISRSVRLGVEACTEQFPDIQGILFSVCDQPALHTATIQRILNAAGLHRGKIISACHQGRPGNPVLWDKKFFHNLRRLSGDNGGRQIMSGLQDKVRYVETQEEELKDIDFRSDLSE
ncbi:EF2563 family selenium-dependent molybdenum hydroxylase system protein [Muricomes sp. OA1]|uniref:EF2563 family selenium-dependent molybdenum hydroxylase system protein n=1 Tax=Hungatella hathewayi TaxID=154046 RepID=A0A3E2X0N0_9FIRM|nr:MULTISPECIES: selenium-dependent molybdenum cofactor biosynthesis protein YqeB [Clostridia]MCH1973247.1 EF2563 family selenium-dependent molybdenum hydroxylase system protein [Muricomes sp. OA1]RGC33718.1 EF2563 family selenium-dependent molybdenum hydroxylase system protein [Hungatella hathewayi]GKH32042.1 hypothetical protein CE91St64_14490 [Faecalicatena contorta]